MLKWFRHAPKAYKLYLGKFNFLRLHNGSNGWFVLIIFGKMHFLSISENDFFHEIIYLTMTSFVDFKQC